MMIQTRTLVVVATALGLAACAQAPKPGTAEYAAQQEEAKRTAQIEHAQAVVTDAPSWFTGATYDEQSIFAPGTSQSSDLQLAIDKAILSAKRNLADRVNSRISSKLKELISESGSGENAQVQAEAERVTNNSITEVNLAGYNIKEQKLVSVGAQYRVYVLLQYPLGAANKVLSDQVNQSSLLQNKLRASKAFQELEQDIKSAQGGGGMEKQ